jgi:hypothetical protein
MAVVSTNEGKTPVTVRFTANGTWAVPWGVFYAEAEVVGGGAGGAAGTTAGSNSDVVFTGGTITASGMASSPSGSNNITGNGSPNTGGGRKTTSGGNFGQGGSGDAVNHEAEIVNPTFGGAAVTPGTNVAVTVGAGGGTTNAAGGSGYAIITYYR